jgi:hypothetical protein
MIHCVVPLLRNTLIRLTFIGSNMDTLQQQETKAFLELIEALKKAEIDLAIAQQRIAYLEAQVYGGSTK